MRYGLPQASFIPPKPQRDLRDLTQYRTKLVQERSCEVNLVQGVLERADIKLASVASDILGTSGPGTGRLGRGVGRPRNHGRVDHGAAAEQEPRAGAGLEGPDSRPSSAAAGHPVGP